MDENSFQHSTIHRDSRTSRHQGLPVQRIWPAVDDHLVVPEVTRDEMVRGDLTQALPAEPPHGDLHSRLSLVIGNASRHGNVASNDLLTRWSEDSDFATDISIRKVGTDPTTGRRYLEEVTFTIVSYLTLSEVRCRAEDMAARGVRRIFAIFVEAGELHEWSAKLGAFQPLAADASIQDDTLIVPVPVKAIFDRTAADATAVRALKAKDGPEIRAIREESRVEDWAESRVKGRAEGHAESIVKLLKARGIEVSQAQRRQLLACRDLPTLEKWFGLALTVKATEELLVRAGGPSRSQHPYWD